MRNQGTPLTASKSSETSAAVPFSNTAERSTDSATWVDTEEACDALLLKLAPWDVLGFDTEFYGVNLGSESCVGTAVVDVFSLAAPSLPLTALGFNRPESWVIDGRLLTYPPMQALLEDEKVLKPVHNQPVDAHACRNAGVRLRGGVNTLAMARWLYPERAALQRGNFDLNSLCLWKVGFGKTEEFDALFGYDAQEPYTTSVEKNYCVGCESFGCSKKKPPHDVKVRRESEVTRTKKVRRHLRLSEVRPGHPLFDRYRIYAAVDAELALILYQMMLRDGRKERDYPWGGL